ncbi:hypothetical protein ACO0LB_06160 [Undibacterium sp. SXout7W]|uniref:hypothetical protein n=1 Tax=Undibacterium sp. SXout7W TaxID=3413049 RepID=UPI003BF2A4C9
MKQAEDKFTVDLFRQPRRGRPRSPDSKSGAQRQREYRERQKQAKSFSSQRNGNE